MAQTTTHGRKARGAVGGSAVRRRSARHAEAIDKQTIKDENGEGRSGMESDGENENGNENGNGNENRSQNGHEDEVKGTSKPRTKKRGLTDSLPPAELRRSKRAKQDERIKEEKDKKTTTTTTKQTIKKEKKDVKPEVKLEVDSSPASSPRVKTEETEASDNDSGPISASQPKKKKTTSTAAAAAAADLQARKLKSYTQFAAARQSPYPDFSRPRAEECKLAHSILASLHGERTRPSETVAPASRAGCGDSASVLDALVRTILSQNTSDVNSSRAKLSMDATYGSSCAWDRIVAGGEAKLAKAIESGGLAVVKSRAILSILRQTHARYGSYSLDHLFGASDDDAMRELIAFKGVGPKTASCVLLFCLQRASFAVDTHVHRITGLLGWRPADATRDLTHAHLDARIPDEDKYGLHVLLVRHGKECAECRAGGKSLGRCELRKAFRKGKVMGEAGEAVKAEELQQVKVEEEESDVDVKE
ncbi:DNA glycosylase [Nemania sp. FL0031]|nr:DNA glycosylase [Nemania sp. FL0031]